MAASVVATARRKGHAPDAVDGMAKAMELAMGPRLRLLDDDHHPAFLHPGRTALVLLTDVPGASPDAITLATLVESRDAKLRVEDDAVAALLGARLAAEREAIPHPGAQDLVERLVTLPQATALAALAERLDHLRHEHLREPSVPWEDLVAEVERAWLPVAERMAPELARRYAHWHRTFRRRL